MTVPALPPPARTRLTFSGIFGTVALPIEQWSFNLSVGQTVFASQAERETLAAGLKDSWVSALAPMHAPRVLLTRVRVAQVGTDGKVGRGTDGSYNQGDWLGAVPGSGVQNLAWPLQTALCVSLVTRRSGPSGRGRFFLPPPDNALELSTYQWSPANVANYAERAGQFIDFVDGRISNTTSPGGKVVVASSKGFLSVVTGIRVGSVPDTMRSRRGDMIEAYVSRPVQVA